jgi:hypothetical protein
MIFNSLRVIILGFIGERVNSQLTIVWGFSRLEIYGGNHLFGEKYEN